MTRVVIVGEVYTSPNEPPGLWPGGGGGEHPGNRPPGSGNYPSGGPVPPSGPTDPGYGHPDWGGHPGNRPPGSGGGGHPGNRPPGSGFPHPGNRPPGSGSGGQIDNSLPEGEPIPPDAIQPPFPELPEEYADKVVVAIKKPDEEWRATAYEAETFPDQGLPPVSGPK